MRSRALSLAALVAIVAAWPSIARAQDTAACDAATRLRDEGKQAYEKGDHARALENFQAAYDQCPLPKWRFNIALALDELGRQPEALEMYESALADGKDADADTRAFAQQRVSELQTRVGTIVVTSAVDGAEVRVDGDVRGRTPLARPLRVRPGSHRVQVAAQGRAPFTSDVSVRAGETRSLAAELSPVDDGTGDPSAPVGAHVERSMWQQHRWSLIAAGSSIALAGAGVGLGYWTWSKYRDLSAECADTAAGCARDDVQSVERRALATNVLLGMAGAAAVTSAILYVFIEREPTDSGNVALVSSGAGAALIVRY